MTTIEELRNPAQRHHEYPRTDVDVDVLIIGAGLSGIGAACHLRREAPWATYLVLEAREAIGGTWDLFRYPGVRSDSDMYTFGYSFRPWTGDRSLADGASIRQYIQDTADEYGVPENIRFGHRAISADWSSQDQRWTVRVEASPAEQRQTSVLTCAFLFANTGYYRYDEGYTPPLPGLADFAGTLVHPQHWPTDLDVTGKRVIVIGSGATAITLVPTLAETAEHVVMLQRTPTYVAARPARDKVAGFLSGHLPAQVSTPIVRWKNILTSVGTYELSRRSPALMKGLLRKWAAAELPEGYDVQAAFEPSYDPWDQRLCLAQDGDLFHAVAGGRAEIVTGRIDTILPDGIRLTSGDVLPADVIVTATGLTVLMLGGMTATIDGRTVDYGSLVAYKGMMFSGVPNFALTIGYANASWTLKADLVASYVCRLLNHLRDEQYASVAPVLPDGAGDWERVPLIDLQAGYVLRSLPDLPAQGPKPPWRMYQNYPRDVALMRYARLDGALRFVR